MPKDTQQISEAGIPTQAAKLLAKCHGGNMALGSRPQLRGPVVLAGARLCGCFVVRQANGHALELGNFRGTVRALKEPWRGSVG